MSDDNCPSSACGLTTMRTPGVSGSAAAMASRVVVTNDDEDVSDASLPQRIDDGQDESPIAELQQRLGAPHPPRRPRGQHQAGIIG
jgi:hypothetical protein